jgi:D-alanyl-D-alanine carboxypeptidase
MSNKKIFKSILIMVILSISHPSFAQEPVNTTASGYKVKADSLLEDLFKNNKLMASVAIAKSGKIIYEKATGYSQIKVDGKKASTIDTKYRIGSITKMFTAAMIFQLVEEKKLTLDDKLANYFPDLPNSDSISIGNLLNHRSGLFNITDDSTYSKWDTSPQSEREMLRKIKSHKPDFQPGEKAAYSNTNYILLGYIIEKLTGKSYSDELKNRIIDKIGLKNTYYGHKINPNDNEASSYSFPEKNWIQSKETDMSIPGGAGGIVSTPGDLDKFIYSLFTGKLISRESLNKMTTIQDNFGMGIFQNFFYENKGYGHSGGIDGFISSIEYFPGDSVALAFCSNGMNYNLNDILKDLLSIYYDKPFVFPSFKTINIPIKQLAKYEGVYTSPVLNLKITVKRKDNILTAQATNQSAFPLSAVSETQFKFDPAGVTIDFTISKEGQVNEFYLKQGPGSYLFSRDK